MAAESDPGNIDAIVSYNVHGCRGRDGRHDIDRCVSVLSGLNPMVVGLQEVDSREGPDVWRIFADRLGMYPLPGPTLFRNNGHYGNLLLTRHPVQHVRHHYLGVSGREPRRAIDAVVEVPAGTLRIIITHLGLNRKERQQQLQRLAAIVTENWDGRPVIIMGDLNEWFRPGQIARRIHPRLHCPNVVRTWPAGFPLLALDQMLCYPANLLSGMTTLRTSTACIASDHRPLTAALNTGNIKEGNGGP